MVGSDFFTETQQQSDKYVMKKSTCVIVLGPYRSGTSLTAKTLSNLGVYFGPQTELYEPSEFNPDGYYQRPDVSKANAEFIKSSGGTLMSPPHPLMLYDESKKLKFTKLKLDWRGSSEYWGLKDPRFCATLAAWIKEGLIDDKNLKIVRVTRGLEKSAESCVKHYDVGPMCGRSLKKATKMLSTYHEYASWHVDKIGAPCISIRQEDFESSSDKTVRALADFLGVHDFRKLQHAVKNTQTGKSKW